MKERFIAKDTMPSARSAARKTPAGRARVPRRAATYSKEGVDLTLMRWMLSLTPAQRLAVLQSNVRAIMSMRNARSRS